MALGKATDRIHPRRAGPLVLPPGESGQGRFDHLGPASPQHPKPLLHTPSGWHLGRQQIGSIPAALVLLFCLLANQAKAGLTTWDPQALNTQSPYSTLHLDGTWEGNRSDPSPPRWSSCSASWRIRPRQV